MGKERGEMYETMETLRQSRPDATVMDIRMPYMDGVEALGKIVVRYMHMPVIIHTAYQIYEDHSRSSAAEV